MLESIKRVYEEFDKVIFRPTAFSDNQCCCVGEDYEQKLLHTPREELQEVDLAVPIDNTDGCFASYDQMAYFIPRLLEILEDTEEGFSYGNLDISFFRIIRDHKDDFKRLGLWDVLCEALYEIFKVHTAHSDIDSQSPTWLDDLFNH